MQVYKHPPHTVTLSAYFKFMWESLDPHRGELCEMSAAWSPKQSTIILPTNLNRRIDSFCILYTLLKRQDKSR